jgi:hypothetical protein
MNQGRCLCGTVRFEIDGPYSNMLHCHCSMCRKHHGAAFATFVAAPLVGFRYTAGEASIGHYVSSPGFRRSFCTVCGSVMPEAMPAMGLVISPAGDLEGDLGITPQMHMFTGSKATWYEITDDLPQYEEYPPEFGMSATPRAKVETKGDAVQGSCLCGDVAYEISGPPLRMFYCHCSRCRRARSAEHAANVFFKADGFRWVRGAGQVQDYQFPEAKFFGTAFCRRCGGGVPRVSVERGAVVVPAGSIDNDPGMRAQAHLFVDSKAPWDRITDSIPQFAEMPPTR